MKICLSKFAWNNCNNIWVTGFVRKGDKYLIKDDLISFFSGLETISDFENLLKTANGQFSVVIERPEELWAATDRLRNFPLFYTLYDGRHTISDDCYQLAGMQSENRFKRSAYNCFLLTGYVINNLTLIGNIFQVSAGEYVVLGGKILRKFYHNITFEKTIEREFYSAASDLNIIVNNVFKSHFKALAEKFLAISLSGGYDSRLIAAMCSKYHPDNVICYTYGIKNSIESARAGEAAEQLGIKWINIEYNSALIKDFLLDDNFKRYFHYASGLSSMFFLQGYFAVKHLKENKIVPDDCVFITGFSGDTMAGGHLVPSMIRDMNRDEITELIFKEYFGLIKQDREKNRTTLKSIRENIPEAEEMSWKVFESWNQKERQAKFVVNSAKVFSFFDYQYVLPLWDNDLGDFFSTLPFKLKLDKKLYDYVLKEYVFKDLNLNLKGEINPLPFQKAFQRLKDRFKRYIPYGIKNIFIKQQSNILYDEITKLLIEDLGAERVIHPVQSNLYNSYITQWYILKTEEELNIMGFEE